MMSSSARSARRRGRATWVTGPRALDGTRSVAYKCPVPSVTRVRVRYKDTDTMSVVYYGNYLTYFEVARVEYLRERGLPMSQVDKRVHLPVVEALVRYVKPARLDDLLEVSSK